MSGIACAVVAAALLGASAAWQRRRVVGGAPGLRGLIKLFGDVPFLLATATAAVGWLFQLAAVHLVGAGVAGPVLALGVVVTGVAEHAADGRVLPGRRCAGLLGVSAGLAGVATVAARFPGRPAPLWVLGAVLIGTAASARVFGFCWPVRAAGAGGAFGVATSATSAALARLGGPLAEAAAAAAVAALAGLTGSLLLFGAYRTVTATELAPWVASAQAVAAAVLTSPQLGNAVLLAALGAVGCAFGHRLVAPRECTRFAAVDDGSAVTS